MSRKIFVDRNRPLILDYLNVGQFSEVGEVSESEVASDIFTFTCSTSLLSPIFCVEIDQALPVDGVLCLLQ